MSTFTFNIAGKESKLDQSDAAFVCGADHTVTVGVEDSVPEASKLDQKDDFVAPTVAAAAPTPEVEEEEPEDTTDDEEPEEEES